MKSNLLKQIYNSKLPSDRTGKERNGLYFNYGRDSLFFILKLIHNLKKTKIAVPEYICEDVFETLIYAGVDVVWYKIGLDNFTVLKNEIDGLDFDAILLVNYFGKKCVDQNILSFLDHKIIIEDCAHLQFSDLESYYELPRNRNYFRFNSLRKILPVSSGASLVCSNDFKDDAENFYKNLNLTIMEGKMTKVNLRSLLSYLPLSMFYYLIYLNRKLRKTEDVFQLNELGNSSISFPFMFWNNKSLESDRKRRSLLHSEMTNHFAKRKEKYKIISFNENEIPYAFVVKVENKEDAKSLIRFSHCLGVDLVRWPKLPKPIEDLNKEEYQQVYFVPFSW